MNLWAIFFTGLTTGGLSCLAMQGGLIASFVSNQKRAELVADGGATKRARTVDPTDWMPVLLFLLSKLVVHVALGFLLGWLGSKMELSLTVRLLFQTLAALFMLATVGNLLNLHPIFRYVILQPPSFVRRWLKRTTAGESVFTPVILGALTLFIPCGVTQAMEVVAITSGSPVAGALTMGAFVLGTMPLFATVGVATARLSEVYQQQFLRFAAILLVLLAVSSLNGVLVVLDSPLTIQRVVRPFTYFFSEERFGSGSSVPLAVDTTGQQVQKVQIQAVNDGYVPNRIKVKAGVPVELTLSTVNNYTCASYFVFKEFGIKLQLGPTDSKTVTFTPTKKGRYQFTCAMGMYTGVMEVI